MTAKESILYQLEEMTMNREEYDDKITSLKNNPMFISFVADLSINDLKKMCMAWSMAETRFIECDEENNNPWMQTEFDTEKFRRLADCKRQGAFESLLRSNIIYPDGTFNNEILTMKEAANGNTNNTKHRNSNTAKSGRKNSGVYSEENGGV